MVATTSTTTAIVTVTMLWPPLAVVTVVPCGWWSYAPGRCLTKHLVFRRLFAALQVTSTLFYALFEPHGTNTYDAELVHVFSVRSAYAMEP